MVLRVNRNSCVPEGGHHVRSDANIISVFMPARSSQQNHGREGGGELLWNGEYRGDALIVCGIISQVISSTQLRQLFAFLFKLLYLWVERQGRLIRIKTQPKRFSINRSLR